jgi:hypothetical protein
MVDVRLALKSNRQVTQWEQHIHSFLEVMPFWAVPLMVLLHEPTTHGWSLRRRHSVLSKRDLAGVAGAMVLAGGVPYTEELMRCVKQARLSPLAAGELIPVALAPAVSTH